MQDNSDRRAEHAQNEMWLRSLIRSLWSRRDIRLSLGCACLLLAWDGAYTGSFIGSLFCCPIWFLGIVLKSAQGGVVGGSL